MDWHEDDDEWPSSAEHQPRELISELRKYLEVVSIRYTYARKRIKALLCDDANRVQLTILKIENTINNFQRKYGSAYIQHEASEASHDVEHYAEELFQLSQQQAETHREHGIGVVAALKNILHALMDAMFDQDPALPKTIQQERMERCARHLAIAEQILIALQEHLVYEPPQGDS